jgi:IrrE N-terminal-like domain
VTTIGTLVNGSDITARLRALVPGRALTWSESHSLAERQATALLRFMHIDAPPVPQFILCNLPGVFVDWREDWPTAGMTLALERHYRIVICSNEPRWRQRFSLAHEYKHVLDDPLIERLFTHLDETGRHERAERLCNYFAACLLMPRVWIKRDWCAGLQDILKLARRYYVSTEAMSTRLSELGLTPMTLAVEPGPTRHAKEAR